jgi:hypothetical protein
MDLRLLMAFFHSFLFLDASLRFLILPVTIPVQTQFRHLLLRLPLVLTSSGWLFKNFLDFSGTIHPIDVAEPIQSCYVCKCDSVHVSVQSAVCSSSVSVTVSMSRYSLQSVPPVNLAVYISMDSPKGFPIGCPQPFINSSPEGPCFCSIQDDDGSSWLFF